MAVIRIIVDRIGSLFSPRKHLARQSAAEIDVYSGMSYDEDGLAETRLVSDPSYLDARPMLSSSDESSSERRLSWPARDAASGTRRPLDITSSPRAAALGPDVSLRVSATRHPQLASRPSDDATVMMAPGWTPPPLDDATVLVTARKRTPS